MNTTACPRQPGRRRLLQTLLLLPAGPWVAPAQAQTPFDAAALQRALQDGGVVLALRHALAPGTFDPPGFRVGDCSTQRNLNDTGREQSRQIGRWFEAAGLPPAQVRSSPWCRCIDTATLAFGRADVWPALGSPHGTAETVRNAQRAQLLQALAAVSAQRGRLEVWVTHAFVQSALASQSTGSGEALALRGQGDRAALLGRLAMA
jgi:phosphohistidine phosphatase SixA